MLYRFSDNRMPRFMKGNDFFLLRIHNRALFLQPSDHPVNGFVEVRQSDRFFILPGRLLSFMIRRTSLRNEGSIFGLVMQDHVEQAAVHRQPVAVVIDESKPFELVHETTDL